MTRLPPWLRKKTPKHSCQEQIREKIADRSVHSVCESALCPNRGECFTRGTMTFLIMGPVCTRQCTFCAITQDTPAALDQAEPQKIADAAKKLSLEHIVITSVTRDDLSDGGVGHYVRTISAVHSTIPEATIEVLIPDLSGKETLWAQLLDTPLTVLNHNIETIPRLYPTVRPQADHECSLKLLRYYRDHSSFIIKSGLMVGLGETKAEVEQALRDLQSAGCQLVTIGQYIQPSRRHLAVTEYVTPERFKEYAEYGEDLGMQVFAGPWVRSSYRAGEQLLATSF
jgi:lipoic acid synthetase